ncbi:nucleoside monophosphate kinase [Candidatus Daviesbacteria bacterium]|nr:nucleoside monophosphate kinase [Candidatus Daviesbacteria bacterium]
MKMLFIGPVGSGKSTQAGLLSSFLNIPYITTGDILRKVSDEDTELGRRVREDIQSGVLVNDRVVAEIIEKRVSEDDCREGYVVDGYPRTLKQIEIFDPGFDKVFYLHIPDQEAVKRLLKRGRVDDKEEVIQKRLNVYYLLTQPLLAFYENMGNLIKIPATESIDRVQQQVREYLKGETTE